MEITIPTRPRTAKIGYINPGAHSDVRTNEVAIAGLDVEAVPVGVLVLTGPKATSAHTLERIGSSLRGLPVIAILNHLQTAPFLA